MKKRGLVIRESQRIDLREIWHYLLLNQRILRTFAILLVCFSTTVLGKDSNSSHFGRMGLNWQMLRSPVQLHK